MAVELAVVDANSLVTLTQAQREAAVTAYLTDARDRLAHALEATGPQAVAQIKAEICTAAEATKQLGLSKEIRDDATEMARRAEFAVNKAIKHGVETGDILSVSEIRRRNGLLRAIGAGQVEQKDYTDLLEKPTPADIEPTYYNNASRGGSIKDLGETGATDDDFEEALANASEEGDLSRANVIRKIRKQVGPRTRVQRADLIAQLAPTGATAAQMVSEVGVSEESIREIARSFGIDLPGERAVYRTRRIDPIRVARETVMAADGLASTVDLVSTLDGLDPREAQQWTASLTSSIRALNRLNNKIKEAVL